MGVTAAVVGASGYAGGELLRLLAVHPQLTVEVAVANTKAGGLVTDVHPGLGSYAGLRLSSADEADLSRVQVVFLALPHGQSAAVAGGLPDEVRVVDLGADFRLADARRWERFYGGAHAGSWVYGLPELPEARPAIERAGRVANPGCYATAITLGLAPLVAAGLIDLDASPVLSVVAASGVSGAGRSASERLLGAETMGDLTAYKAGGAHQHIPEIEQTLQGLTDRPLQLSFTPVLAPMPRGILAVCSAQAASGGDTVAARAAVASAYDGEAFVRLLPEGAWPHTAAVLGSNSAHLQVVAEPDTGRLVAIVAIDNLGKGAAGQAVQNANLMLGFDERLGLPIDGVAP